MRERVQRSLGALVVARVGRPDCPALGRLLAGWDGLFTVPVRKRVARHVEGCLTCTRTSSRYAAVSYTHLDVYKRQAVLKRNLSSPNVGVQIATNTPAYLSVFVSKNPPVIGPNGPSFGGVAPMDHTDDLRTGWTAQLAPLQPSTQYHVIVRAIDADGDKAFRYGSFTTTSGQVGPGGLANPAGPAGCSLQCITTAKLTQAAGDKAGTEVGLDVVSHTEALFQASFSRNAPTVQAGVPTFADTDAWATSGLQYAKAWQTPLTGLAPATKYYIVVRAEDKQARVSYRSGSFTTATSPTVTASFALVSVHIDQDGDTIGRGEISLGWRVGDTTVATFAERKRDDGDLVTFGTTPWAEQVPMAGFLPTVYVSATERDPDGLVELCTICLLYTSRCV